MVITVMLKEGQFHVRTNFFPSVPHYFSELMAVPVGINYECTLPLMSEKTVRMIFPANAAGQHY